MSPMLIASSVALVIIVLVAGFHLQRDRRRAVGPKADAPPAPESSEPPPRTDPSEPSPWNRQTTRSVVQRRAMDRVRDGYCAVSDCASAPTQPCPSLVEERPLLSGLLWWAGALPARRWRLDRKPGSVATLCVWHRDIVQCQLEETLAHMHANVAAADLQRVQWLHERVAHITQELADATNERMTEAPPLVGAMRLPTVDRCPGGEVS